MHQTYTNGGRVYLVFVVLLQPNMPTPEKGSKHPQLIARIIEDQPLMLTVLALYLLIQNLESYVLMPIVFQETAHLPPLLTIISQILPGALFNLQELFW